ncbi:hypothetical protein RFI_23015 [Reticulomyxa filosa]|uniref:Uncharacterized protein n=1 Tax=Reticulomyxa filosa TaxID=46433 RepID=X6MMP7_RETFI|nr:hypothetical protein RFI_23015 [Reticulomyxa filosa]|eukprot:ETO14355.1 hypothetical protein RFI_23015 [Reticulomyxa filosa]
MKHVHGVSFLISLALFTISFWFWIDMTSTPRVTQARVLPEAEPRPKKTIPMVFDNFGMATGYFHTLNLKWNYSWTTTYDTLIEIPGQLRKDKNPNHYPIRYFFDLFETPNSHKQHHYLKVSDDLSSLEDSRLRYSDCDPPYGNADFMHDIRLFFDRLLDLNRSHRPVWSLDVKRPPNWYHYYPTSLSILLINRSNVFKRGLVNINSLYVALKSFFESDVPQLSPTFKKYASQNASFNKNGFASGSQESKLFHLLSKFEGKKQSLQTLETDSKTRPPSLSLEEKYENVFWMSLKLFRYQVQLISPEYPSMNITTALQHFVDASIVIAVHGAAEQNLFISNPGTLVLEICPPYMHCKCYKDKKSSYCPGFYSSRMRHAHFFAYAQETESFNCTLFCQKMPNTINARKIVRNGPTQGIDVNSDDIIYLLLKMLAFRNWNFYQDIFTRKHATDDLEALLNISLLMQYANIFQNKKNGNSKTWSFLLAFQNLLTKIFLKKRQNLFWLCSLLNYFSL